MSKQDKIKDFIRRWNRVHMLRTGNHIWAKAIISDMKEHNFTILLFGAKTEEELNSFIFNKISSSLPNKLKEKIINTGINNTLLEFAAMISAIDLTIAGI